MVDHELIKCPREITGLLNSYIFFNSLPQIDAQHLTEIW